ncbi:MAG: GNAT family N-acetyltransferase, partial [Robiginitomaculum sp.]
KITGAKTAVMPTRIETPRLILRAFTLNDASSLARLAGDFDISKMTCSFAHPLPLLSAEFWLMKAMAKRRTGIGFAYAIEDKSVPGMRGDMDIFRHGDDWEIGYFIGKPYWGQGYATEAGRAIIKAAQDHLGAREIKAATFGDNPGSGHVLEKLGFVKTGESAPAYSNARMAYAGGFEYLLNAPRPNK